MAWHDWESLGDAPFVPGFELALSWYPGRLDLFGRDSGGNLTHVYFDGNWQPMETLSTSAIDWASPLTGTCWGYGRIDLFAWSTDENLVHQYFDGARWSGRERLGTAGRGMSPPVVVSWGRARLDVFSVEQRTGQIWHQFFDGSRWNGFEPLFAPVPLASPLEVVSWGAGRLDLFSTAPDGRCLHWFFNGSWNGPEDLAPPGTYQEGLRVISWGAGRLDLFSRQETTLLHQWFDGHWHGPQSLLANFDSPPQVVSWGGGRLDVFAQQRDGGIAHVYFDGHWRPQEDLGGQPTLAIGSVRAISWGDRRLDLFAVGTDKALWHKWFYPDPTGSVWDDVAGAITDVLDAGRDIVERVTEPARSVADVVLRPIDVVVQAAEAFPVLGAGLRWTLNSTAALAVVIASIPDFALTLLGIMPRKKLRLCVVIQRDRNGAPVVDVGTATAAADFAHRVYLDEANVEIISAGDRTVRSATSDSDTDTLDVVCGSESIGQDVGAAGSKFQLLVMKNCPQGASGRLTGLGSPAVAFAVRKFTDGKTGCSLGPLTDYVLVDFSKDTPVLAHELGHACNLFHDDSVYDTDNLMYSSSKPGVVRRKLNAFQKALLRASRHCTFF